MANIELKNVNSLNKGAHLMLKAILQEFTQRKKKEVTFSAVHGFGRDYFSLASNGLHQTPKGGRKRTLLSNILSFTPKNFRRELGIVLSSEVDHILDGSGFAYGDFWGTRKPDKIYLDHVKSVKGRGGKVILLPQALGPFTQESVRENFRPLADAADLVIARDPKSYGFLTETYGESDRFLQFPDFTNLLATPEPSAYPEGNVCVIPNYKMLKVAEAEQAKYFRWLEHCCNSLLSKGMRPYWLIHEGELDKDIAERVNKTIGRDLPIVMEDNPLVIKHRIKSSLFIVVSRFHGLVSGMSQGVPSITTSWSHKYRMIMEDYHSTEYLIDVFHEDAAKDTDALLDILTKEDSRAEKASSISRYAQIEKEKSRKMWDTVFKTLDL